ncbi:MAG: GNAT family N-acetyltransferase [Verrucomicrobiae bacterium]|nr:GNAT family N-acetyltransferase [Verrucomicrobiae bacterium]
MKSLESQSTKSLTAERIEERHFPEICRLHSDREVMRTLSADGEVLSEAQTREGLERQCAHWERHGFGLWVFREMGSGEFVGRGGMQFSDIEGEPEPVVGLAYAVLSEYWGRGYATEMASLCLAVASEDLGRDRVSSWTLPSNRASQRVMEKVGFEYRREFTFAGLEHWYYEIGIGE